MGAVSCYGRSRRNRQDKGDGLPMRRAVRTETQRAQSLHLLRTAQVVQASKEALMHGRMMPNFHDLPIGDDFPTQVNVVVEIPRGARTKYEYDAQLGLFRLDRVLYAAVHYPTVYGFIPQTRWDDGDPLDILLVLQEALFPGCLVEARPLAL